MNDNTINLTPLKDLPDSSWAISLPPSDHKYFIIPAAPVILAKPVSRLRRTLRLWPIFVVMVAILGAIGVLTVQDAMKYPEGYVPAATRAVMNAHTYPFAVGPSLTVPIVVTTPLPDGEGGKMLKTQEEGGECLLARLSAPSTQPDVSTFPPPPPVSSYRVKLRVKKRPATVVPLVKTPPVKSPPLFPAPRHSTVADLIAAASPGELQMAPVASVKVDLPPLTRFQIMEVLKDIRKSIQRCWDRFHVPGTVDTRFTIEPSGEVSGLKILGRFSGTPTGACVAAAIGRQMFPKSGKPAKIHIPFVLR